MVRGSGRINQHQQREEQLGWRTIYRTKRREKIKKGQKIRTKKPCKGAMTLPSSFCTAGLCPGATTSKRLSCTRGTDTKNALLEPELGHARDPRDTAAPAPQTPNALGREQEGGLRCLGTAPHPDHGSDLQLALVWGIRRETAPPEPTQPSQKERNENWGQGGGKSQ